MQYVEIVLPIALRPLTYHVEEGEQVRAGMAVMVSIGARKLSQGIVWRVSEVAPGFRTKPIGRVLYDFPLLGAEQMRLWEWVAEYYMCSLGEVMAAAIPAMLRPEGMSEQEFEQSEFKKRKRKAKEVVYDPEPLPLLTPAQMEAFGQIGQALEEKPAALLHGVTGSGKTELFIHLAAEALERGQSVLYLLPEIPLSWPLIARLGAVFGQRLVTYTSKFTPRQRADLFMQFARGEDTPRIIVGTRMALLLPLRGVGLVIVDEEHDGSFKQDSPAPRFHARDTALMLASIHGAKTLLGSATPSIESYYHAASGKYGLVSLTERYGGVPMPRVEISDTLRAVKRGERHAHFNQLLLDRLGEALGAGKQAILFQNRRGFSPWVECGACGWVAHCPDCNVTLTLHKASDELRCHYCGRAQPLPRRCPSCGQGELLPRGFGTEKVEEELARIFPEARITRLDSDVAASARATKRIIADFAAGRTDVLVGTQMVTKSFDFAGVRLVGVVNADNLLNYPDFRASERAFQLLTQAAGRAGRRAEQGEVVVQSSQPDHPILAQVAAGDYSGMARTQLAERQAFAYPPFTRLIAITLRHAQKSVVDEAAAALAAALRPIFGRRVLGPDPPAVDRVQNLFLQLLLLKIERGRSAIRAKALLRAQIEVLQQSYKTLSITINVDPQ